MATPTLIAIIVSCIVFALFVGLLLMFCRCKRNQSKKSAAAKDYEMDSVRPSIVAAQQSQAPPPYYPASGLDNKALEHSMDLALSMEEQKSALYATQNGYSYHPGSGVVGGGIGIPGHTIPGNECKYPIANSRCRSSSSGSMRRRTGMTGNLKDKHTKNMPSFIIAVQWKFKCCTFTDVSDFSGNCSN